MTKPKTLLVATDFSASSSRAVERAAGLARAWQRPLHLLHVFNPLAWEHVGHLLPDLLLGEDPGAASAAALERLHRELAARPGLAGVSRSQVNGRASSVIAAQAAALDAGLIVIGIRGEGIVHELALGGTAVKVLRRSGCPVLVVRQPAERPYGRIVTATDFSPTATRALRAALALFPAADHVALHASRLPHEERMRLAGAAPEAIEGLRAEQLAEARRQMEAFLTHADYEAAGSVTPVLRPGYPASVLMEELQQSPCDLLVLGRHGQSVLDEQLLGSVTLNLLHHAPCDVLLVP